MSDRKPNKSGHLLTRLFGAKETEPQETEAEAVLMSAAEDFPSLRVSDVMVPRADIIAAETETSLSDLVKAFEDAGHSRLPVFKETLDEPVGMVHVKDLLPYLDFDAKGRTAKSYRDKKVLAQITRPVLFVPPSMRAQDLLRRMQALRKHMAIVVDEYGGTDGLVTLEDLIEPIVGDIEDEHDGEEPEIASGVSLKGVKFWDADARLSIDDFEEAIGREVATPEEDEDVDTLGGLVFSLAGRVPERGEIIPHPSGLEFEVLDADPRRIKKLRVRPISHLPQPEEAKSSA